ncbi:MAG TPA: ergothioneine biosynthesis protein EgtC [Acidimicrobiales bacterium]|nr:ergothioneine biosynthesis protein EgtC [Acidimicrobiales bacterium]
MCRHLAYLGPPVTLDALVISQPWSLRRQSFEPRHQSHGRFNGDGFGVGWYAFEHRREPARFRTPTPMWADRSFTSIAGVVTSEAVLAAVRAASEGLPVEESGNAPFVHDQWLFSLNGTVDHFLEGVGVALRRMVRDEFLSTIQGVTDSEVLFAMTLDLLDKGASLADAFDDVIDAVTRLTTARINLLITDGGQIVASAYGNSLFARRTDDSVIVASEPFDDEPGWEAVPDNSIVEAAVGAFSVRPR